MSIATVQFSIKITLADGTVYESTQEDEVPSLIAECVAFGIDGGETDTETARHLAGTFWADFNHPESTPRPTADEMPEGIAQEFESAAKDGLDLVFFEFEDSLKVLRVDPLNLPLALYEILESDFPEIQEKIDGGLITPWIDGHPTSVNVLVFPYIYVEFRELAQA